MAYLDNEVKDIIKVGVAATAAGGGLLGVTGGDIPVVAGAWGTMMLAIANHHGVSLDEETCVKTCAGILACYGGYKAGSTILSWILVPFTLGGSLLIANGLNALLNAVFTCRVGILFNNLYGEQGYKTAAITFGGHIIRQIFAIPTSSEVSDLKNIFNF